MSTAAEADRDLALVRAVFKAAKTTSAFGLEHQVTRAAAERLRAAIEGIGVPFALQLVADAAYVDRQLVSVPPGEYSSVHTLLRLFDNLGHHELQFDRVPSPREILQLVAVLAEGLVAPSTSAEDTPIPGISWTVIPNAGFGIDSESVDEELFAVTQLALAIADIERAETTYLSEGTWHWTAGLSAVRRLERGLATDRNAMLRALELSPGPWSAARRAVSVGRCVQQALHTVGTPAVLVRAGEVYRGDAVSELGVYSTYLRSATGRVLISRPAGHLVRTKMRGVDEGGVASGFAVLSSPLASNDDVV